MHAALRQFIATNCIKSPAHRVPLVEFVAVFQSQIDWTRSTIIAELTRAGFDIGLDSDKRLHVCGLALAGRWQTVDGRLTFGATR